MNTYPLKFVLVGESGVGKSQLSRRFSNKDFKNDSTATVGMEFSTREIPFERCIIKAQIWDTAGQERFESMTRAYYNNTWGALFVYDVTKRSSFENLKSVWLKQVKDNTLEGIGMVLVGNKVDVDEAEFSSQRAVPVDEARAFAEQEGMDFIETSALTAANVETAFRRLVLSVACSLPDVKAHLELTGLPQGWIRVVTPLPAAAALLASASTDSSAYASGSAVVTAPPPPPPPSDDPSASPPPSQPRATSVSVSASASTPNSRSNSVASASALAEAAGAGLQIYCNYWTGALSAELPVEPAPTDLLYACAKVRLGALDSRRGASAEVGVAADGSSGANTNLSITFNLPARAGRCFCALL